MKAWTLRKLIVIMIDIRWGYGMLDHLDSYRVFYTTARSGSFTKAAEALYVTQPAVTQSIKQLESRLGGQLFFRTPKGVKLTAEGEVLYRYIEQAYHFIEAGERKIAEMHQLLEGEIKIGAGDTLCKHFLLPYLGEYHSVYPAIHIQVTNRTTTETIQLLKAGKIDLGIVNLPVEDKQLVIRESMELQDCFIAGPAYRQLEGRAHTLEELAGYPMLMLEKGSSSRAYIDEYAAGQGIVIQPAIELGSLDLLVDFVQAGFGIAPVIRDFVELGNEAAEVFELELDPPVPPRRVGIVWLRDVPLTSAANRFLEFLPAPG
jgi:LysR family transcriptional regulator, cyn operon transcriptional activator